MIFISVTENGLSSKPNSSFSHRKEKTCNPSVDGESDNFEQRMVIAWGITNGSYFLRGIKPNAR